MNLHIYSEEADFKSGKPGVDLLRSKDGPLSVFAVSDEVTETQWRR